MVSRTIAMENRWKEYLTFTKRERTGIFVLLALIAIVTALPYLFTVAPPLPARAELAALQQQLDSLEPAPVANAFEADHEYLPARAGTVKHSLFEFDPNTLSAAGWRKLGIGERTIRTISHYITKGGRFRKPEDLGKVYGLKPADLQRVLPYVRIEEPAFGGQKAFFKDTAGRHSRHAVSKPPILPVDINTADTTAWIALPGIGSRLAQRICNFREKLGGFYSVDQVAETYALPDSTFQHIKPWLQNSTMPVKKLNINTADANTLKQHPYIRWQVANAIVQFRQQHGPFQSITDVQQIMLVTPEIFQKMAPYIDIK
jgi:competence protein ComEA